MQVTQFDRPTVALGRVRGLHALGRILYPMADDKDKGAAGRPIRHSGEPNRIGRRHLGAAAFRPGPGPPRTATADSPTPIGQLQSSGPPIPPTIEAKQLAPDVRAELLTLDKSTADTVARHLVAAGELLDDDPETALAHAQAARQRSGRIAAIREAVGVAAYHCGDWAQALAEFRAARRMGSKSQLLPAHRRL